MIDRTMIAEGCPLKESGARQTRRTRRFVGVWLTPTSDAKEGNPTKSGFDIDIWRKKRRWACEIQ